MTPFRKILVYLFGCMGSWLQLKECSSLTSVQHGVPALEPEISAPGPPGKPDDSSMVQFPKVQVCLRVHAPGEFDRALCLEGGGGWSPASSLEPHFSAPWGHPWKQVPHEWPHMLELSAQTHSLQPSVGTQSKDPAFSLHPTLSPVPPAQPWGQGESAWTRSCPSLDPLWPRPVLFLGLAGALSSSASRHPWAGDAWTPRVRAVASSGDPELSASSCDLLLSLSQSVAVIILFF